MLLLSLSLSLSLFLFFTEEIYLTNIFTSL